MVDNASRWLLPAHADSEPHPTPTAVGPVPRCIVGKNSVRPIVGVCNGSENAVVPGCTTLMFAPVTPLTQALMRQVATLSGLDPAVDVIPLPGATTPADWSSPAFAHWVNTSLFNADWSGQSKCDDPAVIGGCDDPANWLSGFCLPCAVATDNRTMSLWHVDHTNSTQNSVWFFGSYGSTNDTSYSIHYNISLLSYPWYADAHTSEVKAAIDTAMLTALAQRTAAEDRIQEQALLNGASLSPPPPPLVDYRVAIKPFPVPPPRIQGYDVFSANGGSWLFTVPSVIFFFLLTELVHEKEARLRVGMAQMGLSASALWASWLTYAAVMCLGSTAVLQASGYAAGFSFYTNSAFMSTFLLFLLFAWAMASLAVFLSTIINSTRTAQTVGYSFLLVGFVFQAIICSAYAGLLDLMYATTIYPWVRHLRVVLHIYPPFNFAFAFYSIITRAGTVIDVNMQSVTAGPGFHWSDMFTATTRAFFGYTCELPAPLHSYLVLMLDSCIFLALAVYLDAVLPGPQGTPRHPLFFLGYHYSTILADDAAAGHAVESSTTSLVAGGGHEDDGQLDPGVVAERVAASASASIALHSVASINGAGADAPDAGAPAPVVRVHGLRVVYRSGWSSFFYALTGIEWRPRAWLGVDRWWFGRQPSGSTGGGSTAPPTSSSGLGSGDVIAVNNLSLTVRPNEILALLGHNGAGKTTTISVLTGLVTPSGGEAVIAGHSVISEPAVAQGLMGVCPQHDILWPQLTARETLRLFAAIKGVRSMQPPSTSINGSGDNRHGDAGVEAEVDRVLKQVSLSSPSVQHRAVGNYSGGMKRRLSVAIAALGRPRVLFLDEPTTGMDPVNKQAVWSLIHELKETAAVVLTTHSMEEADALGDRVAIMAGGQLQAVGDPLALKSRYGQGYRLSLVLRDSNDDTFGSVSDRVTELVPGCILSLRDASSVVFTVPFASALQQGCMPALLDWCDAEGSKEPAVDADQVQGPPAGLVREYGVSGPSLESVFIRVSAMAHFDLAESAENAGRHGATAVVGDDHDDDEAAVPFSHSSSSSSSSYEPLPDTAAPASAAPPSSSSFSYGYHALVVKNLTLMTRQRGLCACQLITPMLVLGLLVTLQYIIKTEIGAVSINALPATFVPLNLNQWFPVNGNGADRHRTNKSDVSVSQFNDAGLGDASDDDGSAWHWQWLASYGDGIAGTDVDGRKVLAGLYLKQQDTSQRSLSRRAVRTALDAAARLTTSAPQPPPSSYSGAWVVEQQQHEAVEIPWASVLPSAGTGLSWAHAFAQPLADQLTAPTSLSTGIQRVVGMPFSNGTARGQDCLEFFIYAVQPDPASPYAANASGLAAAIGRFDRVYATDTDPWHPTSTPNQYNNTGGMLGHVTSSWCRLRNTSLVPAPYWDSRVASSARGGGGVDYGGVPYAIDDELVSDLNILVKANITSLKAGIQPPCWASPTTVYNPDIERSQCPDYITPDAALVFHDVRAPNHPVLLDTFDRPSAAGGRVAAGDARYHFAYTLQSNDLMTTPYHRANGLTRLNLNLVTGMRVASPLAIDPGRIAVMDLLLRGYASWAGLVNASTSKVDGGGSEPHSTSASSSAAPPPFGLPTLIAVSSFPDLIATNTAQIVEIIGAVLHPVTLTLQLPLFMFVVVLEKEERLVELQMAMGLRWGPYVAITYGLNLMLYVLVAGLFWLAASNLQFTFFVQTSPVLLSVTLFGWGLSLCSMATLLSSFLWSRQAAVIIGFAGGLFIPLLSSAIAAGIYGFSLPWSLGTAMPPSLYAIPLFGPCMALCRILYLGTFNCLAKAQCYQDVAAVMAPGSEVREGVIALYLSAVVYQVVGLYLEQVLPRRYGVSKHPFFFVPEQTRHHVWSRMTSALGRASHRSPPAATLSASSGPAGDRGSINSALTTIQQTSYFAYIWRWAAAAGLSISAATSVYARGEDDDVYRMRELVDHEASRFRLADAGGPAQGDDDSQSIARRKLALARQYPVLLRHLRKEFPVPKQAGGKGGSRQSQAAATVVKAARGHDTDLQQRFVDEQDSGSAAPVYLQASLADDEAAHLARGSPLDVDAGAVYEEREQTALLSSSHTKVAVSDLSLAIQPGTCVGLLGENGSGKSTTLNMLLGLYPATGGDAYVSGHHCSTESSSVRLSLGVAPQHDTLWPTFTIREHLLFYARVKGVPSSQQDRHVHEAMARVGLAHVANRAAGALSGGMKRRLTLAIALVGNSRVVLLDEPSTGLDPASRRRLWRIIESARREGVRQGRVLILVSHDMAEVEALANSIAIMTYGRVRCMGTGQHLKAYYGGGYQLSIRHSAGRADEAVAWVQRAVPGARVDTRFSSGYVSFLLPQPAVPEAAAGPAGAHLRGRPMGGLSDPSPASGAASTPNLRIAGVFAAMGELTRPGGAGHGLILEWAVGQLSLDAVFQRVVRHYRVADDSDDPESA